jgi:hypothetical protein
LLPLLSIDVARTSYQLGLEWGQGWIGDLFKSVLIWLDKSPKKCLLWDLGFMKRRRLIIPLAVSAFLLCGLFPPWRYQLGGGDAGYSIIFAPPVKHSRYSGDNNGTVDVSRLAIEWICIGVLAAAAWAYPSRDKAVPK